MTRMTGPDCVVMCNLINTYIHTYVHITDNYITGSLFEYLGTRHLGPTRTTRDTVVFQIRTAYKGIVTRIHERHEILKCFKSEVKIIKV